MRHFDPCAYCGGVVVAQDNRWVCTHCEAAWTLGMRLLREGNVLGKALDDVLGPSEPLDDNLRVDTLHQVAEQRYRVRIYDRGAGDVVILTALSGYYAMEDGNAIRAIGDIYALEGATYIIHLPGERPVYTLATPTPDGQGLLSRALALEEAEYLIGVFLGSEQELAEADAAWAEFL